MDNYLEKIQEKNNLIDKILKMQKNLLKVQIIFFAYNTLFIDI